MKPLHLKVKKSLLLVKKRLFYFGRYLGIFCLPKSGFRAMYQSKCKQNEEFQKVSII